MLPNQQLRAIQLAGDAATSPKHKKVQANRRPKPSNPNQQAVRRMLYAPKSHNLPPKPLASRRHLRLVPRLVIMTLKTTELASRRTHMR